MAGSATPLNFEMIAESPPTAGRLRLSKESVDCLLPVKKVRSWDWMKENSYNHKGQPFNHIDYPWMEGIADAWDDPAVKRIFVMAGSRLGKTEEGLCLMQCSQKNDPDVGMIIAPTETLVEQTIGDRFWKMLMKTHATRPLCPPASRQAKTNVRTKTFTIYGAWSGSPTTLGDKDPRYIILYEIDKYTKAKSEEADPFLIAMERGAEIPDRCLYAESTPTVAGKSRIDQHVKLGTNRRFHVPCPHCRHHQQLRVNETEDKNAGGLWWPNRGKSTANDAAKKAVYICESCKKIIRESHRREMIRQGVWCAEGQHVRKDGTLVGRPINDGPDESFQISRLYGATFSFADYARAYEASRGNSEAERSFANNWAGEPWEPIQVQMKWEDLAERLCVGEWEPGVAPEEVNFITSSFDVQIDHFVCEAWGWDRNQVGRLIAIDTVPSWDQVKEWCFRQYKHEDGGPPLQSFVNLIDARDGNRKDEVVDFCRSVNQESGPFVWPLMGAKPGTLDLRWYRRTNIDLENQVGANANKARVIKGMFLIMANTTVSQGWLDRAMVLREPGLPMSIVLPTWMQNDEDFFEQLLNEIYSKEDETWIKVDEGYPVDFRDGVRYARIGAEVYCKGNWSRVPAHRIQTTIQSSPAIKQPQQTKPKRATSFIRKPTNPFLRR